MPFTLDPTRRLGRQPSLPKDIERRLPLAKYLYAMPDPPDVCEWGSPITNWGKLLNDQLGSCGPAAWMHGLMSKVACSQQKVLLPTDNEVVAFYGAAGGYQPGRPWTDQGVNNPTMMGVAQKQGCKIAGTTYKCGPYATVPATDLATIKKGIYYLHGCLVGCTLSSYWYNNFGPGVKWDDRDQSDVGGHDVWGYAYDANGIYIVTWGQPGTLLTWAGAKQRVDDITCAAEVDAEIGSNGRTAQGMLLADWKAEATELTGTTF